MGEEWKTTKEECQPEIAWSVCHGGHVKNLQVKSESRTGVSDPGYNGPSGDSDVGREEREKSRNKNPKWMKDAKPSAYLVRIDGIINQSPRDATRI